MYYKPSLFLSLILSIILFTGCESISNETSGSLLTPETEVKKKDVSGAYNSLSNLPGFVFTQSNDSESNEVIAFKRDADGSLAESGRYATGGQGTGGGLGSQGAVALSNNNQLLLAVNAGSNELSVFAVQPDELKLLDTVPSGGEQPISVTVRKSLVYVVHAGGSGNITGFRLTHEGTLTSLPGSTRNLSNDGIGAAPGPAQISFTPNGDYLIVTEKPSNMIGVYAVAQNGTAGAPSFTASSGETPFGFSFSRKNTLVVSETFGGNNALSATSSYNISQDGALELISGTIESGQTAACWAVTTSNGRFTYISNTGSGTITGYYADHLGNIELLNADGVTGDTGGTDSTPIDMALSNNSRFLYVLNTGTDTILSYSIQADGSLDAMSTISVPASSVGLIAK